MARTIQHKRGLEKNLPTLKPGEMAFTTDSKKVFVGSDTGNIDITSNVDTSKLVTKTELSTVTTQLADTAKKSDLNSISPNQIDKNKGKFDQTYMTEEFLRQIAGNAPINAVPALKSITPEQLAFSRTGKNLFNKDSVVNDNLINPDNGQFTSNTSFVASNHIRVSPNTAYVKNTGHSYAIYDSTGAYITGTSTDKFTTPANAATVRLSVTKAALPTFQFEKGTVATPFETYKEYLPKEYVEKPVLEKTDIPPLGTVNLEFSVLGSNLFNKSTTLTAWFIDGESGTAKAGAGFFASDYIKVDSSTSYTIKAVRHIAYYDNTKKYISGVNMAATLNYKATTPANCAYLRFSWYVNENVPPESQQINKGESLLPYEEYGYKIPANAIAGIKVESEPDRRAILPPKINGVVGKELNIYFSNILNVPESEVQIDVTCPVGRQEERRWTCTPTAAGIYPLTISLYRNYNLISTYETSFIVKAATVGTGTKKALIIGDSTVNAGTMTQRLLSLTQTDNLKINLLGTRGASSNKHEGRGGWTAAKYRTGDSYDGTVNPFYNPTTKDFDFAYYMSNQGYTATDYVGICLGINDTFSFTSDDSLKAGVTSIFSNLDTLINSIKNFNSAIKVGLFVTIPPNDSQTAFGVAYGTEQTQWRYKRNNAIWIEELIKRYKDKESQNIYLIPDNPNIDTKNNIADGVHPNEAGYNQRGDTLFYWLKSFES